MQANEQLRQANLELNQLKNRYGDLYQNAPVMYFSLDDEGRFLVCNNTLLRTLGRERHELIGRPYTEILSESSRGSFAEELAGFLAAGRLDAESRWLKADGTAIDVWITATAVRNADGRVIHSRSVATDITIQKKTLKSATVGRRLAALRSMVKLARTLGRVAWGLEIASPKVQPFRDTAGPGDDGWRAVLERAKAEAAGGSPRAARDLAIVRMLHDLGLRRGELAALDLADVDRPRGTVAILGKGRTETERLTMPDPVRRDLDAWAVHRGGAPERMSHAGLEIGEGPEHVASCQAVGDR